MLVEWWNVCFHLIHNRWMGSVLSADYHRARFWSVKIQHACFKIFLLPVFLPPPSCFLCVVDSSLVTQIRKRPSPVPRSTSCNSVFLVLLSRPDELNLVARLLFAVNLGNTSGNCSVCYPWNSRNWSMHLDFDWLQISIVDSFFFFFTDLNSWIISCWACVDGEVSLQLVFRSSISRSCWYLCYVQVVKRTQLLWSLFILTNIYFLGMCVVYQEGNWQSDFHVHYSACSCVICDR